MAAKSGKVVWVGRVLSGLVSLVFILSGVMKFMGGDELQEEMLRMGLAESLIVPLGILEILCVVVYLVPATSILGAILLTGYLGGAICTHLRVGDAYVGQIVFGVIVWFGLYCRDDRLRALIPVRRAPTVEM